MLVVETVEPATFEAIVLLLGGQGFALVERPGKKGQLCWQLPVLRVSEVPA